MNSAFKKALTLSIFILFLFSLFTPSLPVSATNQKVSHDLVQKIKESNGELISVIVRTEKGLQEKHRVTVNESGGKLKHNLSLINGFSAELSASAINDLAAENEVTGVFFDSDVKACLDIAAPSVNAPAAWDSGLTGKGVTVAVVDTGIYPHPDLVQPVNRIIAFKDLINNRTSPYDDNGHGTHVAGIIAGNGEKSGGQYKGIAPQANLVGVKALNSTGSGSISNVIAGIQWVVNNKSLYNIKVLNLSLGAPAAESYTTDPLSKAAEAAWKAGLVVVTAAGNDGPAAGTIRTPGINPNVITVGAVDDRGTGVTTDDVIAGFSSRGPTVDGLTKPDLVAPGVKITSLASDTSYLPNKNSGSGGKPGKAAQANTQGKPAQTTMSNYYVTMSGTSMATPMVTGIAILLLEQNSTLPPNDLKSKLIHAVNLRYEPNYQGAGEVKF